MKPHSNPGGRLTKYKPDFIDRARAMAEIGAVDEEIAGGLGISLRTLYYWKSQHRDFSIALQRGKDIADDMVEAALFRRATGYSFDAVKHIAVAQGANQGSKIEQVDYVEHVPPDVNAAMFWLKNRRSDRWREKQAVEHSGTLSLAELVQQAIDDKPHPTNSAGLISSLDLTNIDLKETKLW